MQAVVAQIGNIISNLFNHNKSENNSSSNQAGISFTDVMKTVSQENARVVVGDGSSLLNFKNKEEKVITKVPEKALKNVYDLIAEIEHYEHESNRRVTPPEF